MNSTNNRQVAVEPLTFWERLDAKAGELVAAFMGAYADPIERGVNREYPEYTESKSSMTLIAIPNSSIAFVPQGAQNRKQEAHIPAPDLDQLVCAD